MTYNYVEADTRREADERFEAATDQSSYRETCECCGFDYDVEGPSETLDDATRFARTPWTVARDRRVVPLDEYIARPSVLVLPRPRDAVEAGPPAERA